LIYTSPGPRHFTASANAAMPWPWVGIPDQGFGIRFGKKIGHNRIERISKKFG